MSKKKSKKGNSKKSDATENVDVDRNETKNTKNMAVIQDAIEKLRVLVKQPK